MSPVKVPQDLISLVGGKMEDLKSLLSAYSLVVLRIWSSLSL